MKLVLAVAPGVIMDPGKASSAHWTHDGQRTFKAGAEYELTELASGAVLVTSIATRRRIGFMPMFVEYEPAPVEQAESAPTQGKAKWQGGRR